MPKADDEVIDDTKDESNTGGQAPSLDQVHAASQNQVEQEDEDANDEDQSDDSATGDAEDSSDTGEEEASSDDEAGSDDSADESGDDGSDDTKAEPTTPAVEPTVELDNDTTKNGPGKVAIKDSTGTVHYFNSVDEVPDDFEPLSYKALMVGTTALLQKAQSDEKAAEDAKVEAAKQAHIQATNEMQEGWEKDASALSDAGVLPKDPAKLKAAKSEVYDYIEKELKLYQDTKGKEGSLLTNFKTAYKNMVYDQQQADMANKQKEVNDAKKKRGSMVQGGSGGDAGGSSSARGNKVIEAPPTGVGLDAVHARALNSL